MSSARPVADQLAELYPVLADDAPPGWREDVAALGTPLSVPAGTVLFHEGRACQGFPFVLSGDVRVARGAPQGRSIELYRVLPGEGCLVSAACLFGQTTLAAHGEASLPTTLVLLPAPLFMRWSAHEPLRRWVFSVFAHRMADLIMLAEAVAFQRLDQRVAGAVLGVCLMRV